MARVLPMRLKLRNDSELPKWITSSAEKHDPKRANPMTVRALDILAKHRSASALPKVAISRVDTCDP
jgi:hypothetical protein